MISSCYIQNASSNKGFVCLLHPSQSQLTRLGSSGKHQGPYRLLEFEEQLFIRDNQVLYTIMSVIKISSSRVIISGEHCTEKILLGHYLCFCHRAPETLEFPRLQECLQLSLSGVYATEVTLGEPWEV